MDHKPQTHFDNQQKWNKIKICRKKVNAQLMLNDANLNCINTLSKQR